MKCTLIFTCCSYLHKLEKGNIFDIHDPPPPWLWIPCFDFIVAMMIVTLERKRTKMSTMMIVIRRRTKMSMKMATMLTPKVMRLQGYYGIIVKESLTFIIKRTFTKRKCLLALFHPNFLSKNKEE